MRSTKSGTSWTPNWGGVLGTDGKIADGFLSRVPSPWRLSPPLKFKSRENSHIRLSDVRRCLSGVIREPLCNGCKTTATDVLRSERDSGPYRPSPALSCPNEGSIVNHLGTACGWRKGTPRLRQALYSAELWYVPQLLRSMALGGPARTRSLAVAATEVARGPSAWRVPGVSETVGTADLGLVPALLPSVAPSWAPGAGRLVAKASRTARTSGKRTT